MKPREIVSNSGPLISLEKLPDGFDFIRSLYDRIIIPPEVLAEVSVHYASEEKYLTQYHLDDLLEIQQIDVMPELENTDLDIAEIKAISLAATLKMPLIIEERAGRAAARALDIPYSGIAGQVIKAFDQKLLSAQESREKIQTLFEKSRINRKVYLALRGKISAETV